MARAGRFRIAAMEALWAQLEFAPAAATRRMLARIQEIMPTIGTDRLYEPTATVRSIVRFPVEEAPGGEVGMMVGGALRADLAELALRLSRKAPVPEGAGTMGLDEAAAVARVCVRTLRRWRERGLMLHWIGVPGGPMRVGIRAEDLRTFARANPGLCEGAAAFRRVGADARAAIVAAGSPRLRAGEPLMRVARDLAARHGCSAGAVRAMLLGAAARDAQSGHRSSQPHQPNAHGARAHRLWAEWAAGSGVPALARRHGMSARAAAHALRGERLVRLASMRERMLADAAGADAHAPTREEWHAATQGLSVGHFMVADAWQPGPAGAARGSAAMAPQPAHAIVMRALLSRAAACPARPGASELDRAETDIRWAARLLLTLAHAAMPALERRIRVWMSGLASKAKGEATFAIPGIVVHAVLEACRTEAGALRRGRIRIERLAGSELDLALARTEAVARSSKVAARAEAEPARVDDTLATAAPWVSLAPLHDERAGRLGLASRARGAAPRTGKEMLAWRHGWDGGAPSTLDEIALAADRPRWVVASAIDRARPAGAGR